MRGSPLDYAPSTVLVELPRSGAISVLCANSSVSHAVAAFGSNVTAFTDYQCFQPTRQEDYRCPRWLIEMESGWLAVEPRGAKTRFGHWRCATLPPPTA